VLLCDPSEQSIPFPLLLNTAGRSIFTRRNRQTRTIQLGSNSVPLSKEIPYASKILLPTTKVFPQMG
jgi:hypothetical protein